MPFRFSTVFGPADAYGLQVYLLEECTMTLTREQNLSLMLDPSKFFEIRGWVADPWQRDLLRSRAPRILLNCCRQAGKSTTVAALALHTVLFQPESLVLLLSRSQRQSSELFRKVLEFYNAVGRPVQAIGESALSLELINGSRVLSLPGQEENIRGFSGVRLLIIDEAARVPDDLYRAVRPMIAVSSGRLVLLSTPFGRRGFFHDAWTDSQGGWLRVEIPAARVPRISPAYLQEELRLFGRSWYDQEFNCSFEAIEGLVYPQFGKCLVEQVPPEIIREGTRPVSPFDKRRVHRVGGIDFGFTDPFAAVWGFHDESDVLWITNEHYARREALSFHAAKLPREVYWYVDPSGANERKELRIAGFVVRESINSIDPGLAAVTARIETGRLKILADACPNLVAESGLYRYAGEDEPGGHEHKPIDDNNHALDALRYLIARLDKGFLARFRRSAPAEQGGSTPPAQPRQRWLDWGDESLWTRL
jgi:hypothetical protein